MKVEKEVLIKQHFWILLGVLIPLVLVCLIVHWTATASAIEGKERDFNTSQKNLKAITAPKNQEWLNALKVRGDEVAKQKKVIWSEAWDRQKDLLTWPEGLEAKDRGELEKLSFADRIDQQICDRYSKPGGPYLDQFPPLVNLVYPVNDKGEGMVQFNGGWESILRPFDWSQVKAENRPPPAEELWILQEDLAVYRELLRIIRDVNELVATFHQVPGAPEADKSKGEIDHQIFTNSTWKLDLAVAEEKNKKIFHCQMTNISQRRQPLGIYFLIKIKGMNEPQFIFADGEPLAPGASFAVKDKDGNDQGLQTQSGILEGKVLEKVVQWFDWRTAPVKRIDRLTLGSYSQRTFGRSMKTVKNWVTVKSDSATQEAGSGDTPAGGGGGGMNMMQTMQQSKRNVPGGGGYGGGGTADGGGDKTKNSLPKYRYIDVSDQVRRMPIGIAVIIDQDHIQDFLTVVANSKLRIQTAKIYWQRFHGDIKPKITDEKPADGTTSKPKRTAAVPRARTGGALGVGMGGGFGGFDMGQMMGRMQNMRQPTMGGGAGAARTGTVAATTEAGEEELDSNLVELAVHGIASLYERYKETTAAAANP